MCTDSLLTQAAVKITSDEAGEHVVGRWEGSASDGWRGDLFVAGDSAWLHLSGEIKSDRRHSKRLWGFSFRATV